MDQVKNIICFNLSFKNFWIVKDEDSSCKLNFKSGIISKRKNETHSFLIKFQLNFNTKVKVSSFMFTCKSGKCHVK